MSHVNAASDPDLYWALRGAGDSFAVITAFHFDTFKRPEHVVTYELTWTGLNPTDAATVYLEFQRLAQTKLPEEFHLGMDINQPAVKGSVDLLLVSYLVVRPWG
jgi:hypothetical protein